MLPARLRSILLQLGSLVLGLGLLYLAFRAVEFDQLGAVLAGANYWYLVPMGVVAIVSHVLRAWRWLLFLEVLPESEEPASVGLRPAFYSVMIGYMVNYAAPRLGEVARAGNYARLSRMPFSAVFGTVVSERVLDVITLGAGLGLAAIIAARHMAGLGTVVADLTGPVEIGIGMILLGIAIALLIGVFTYWAARLTRRSSGGTEPRGRLVTVAHAFMQGALTLIRLPRRFALVASTAGIWLCYAVMAYLPFPLLGITGLSLGDAWLLLVVGSVGMLVPTPGGIGSYHFVTIETMTRVLGVGLASATAYAVLAHGLQLVLYVVTGFICLILQGRGFAIRREA